MRHRYRSWVEGLNVDWNISRQRFFGVPFPIWYPVDERRRGRLRLTCSLPTRSVSRSTPRRDVPAGYREESQRGQPGGFVGDPDVMDTWATSSLSPQIAGRWGTDLFERVFPMDLRPQAHDIIRTWLFSTIVRSHLQFDSLPFSDALISGWILDPDRKKMSKSMGNAVTPHAAHRPVRRRRPALLGRLRAPRHRHRHRRGPDEDRPAPRASRCSTPRSSCSVDSTTRSLSADDVTDAARPRPARVAWKLITEATDVFENYDYARALERAETFFWSFCDDYVELVKTRAYGEGDDAATKSARATLAITLSVLQRLFAPIMPFVTEEVWSWWHDDSVHLARGPRSRSWPTAPSMRARPINRSATSSKPSVARRVRPRSPSARPSPGSSSLHPKSSPRPFVQVQTTSSPPATSKSSSSLTETS